MFPYLMRSIAKLPNSIKHQSRLTCYFLHISDRLKCSSRLEIDRLGCGSAPNVLPIDAYLRMNRGAHGVANLGYWEHKRIDVAHHRSLGSASDASF